MSPSIQVSEKPPSASAIQFTKEMAEAARRIHEPKFPEKRKQEWRELDQHCQAIDDDGTWLSVVDPNADGHEYGRYGVYNTRTGQWQPLNVGDWVVRHDRDGALEVLGEDEFERRWLDHTPNVDDADDLDDDDDDDDDEVQEKPPVSPATAPKTPAKAPATPPKTPAKQ